MSMADSQMLPRHRESALKRSTKYAGLGQRVIEALADAELSRAELAAQLEVPPDNVNYAVWKLMTNNRVQVTRREGHECKYGLVKQGPAPHRVTRYVPEFKPLQFRSELCPFIRASLCLSIKR